MSSRILIDVIPSSLLTELLILPLIVLEIKVFMNFPRIQRMCSGVPQLVEAILYQFETVPNSEFELNEDKTKIRKKLKAPTKTTQDTEPQTNH
jgi:hypothetical protein